MLITFTVHWFREGNTNILASSSLKCLKIGKNANSDALAGKPKHAISSAQALVKALVKVAPLSFSLIMLCAPALYFYWEFVMFSVFKIPKNDQNVIYKILTVIFCSCRWWKLIALQSNLDYPDLDPLDFSSGPNFVVNIY